MAFQVLSSDKVLRINDTPVLGFVQSLDWNPDFGAQDVFELGNSSKVDTSLELSLSGTMELSSNGGMPGLLSRMVVLRSANVFLGYKYDEKLATFTATAGGTTTVTNQSTISPTASQYVGKYLKVTVAGPIGEWRPITAHGTGASATFTVSPAFSTPTTASSVCYIMGGKNAFTFTEASFTEACFDLIVHEKTDQTNLNRAVVMPRCYLASLSGRAQADGNATESVAFQGDFVAGFPSPFHDVRAVPCTYTSGSTITCADTTIASGTHTLAYVYIDENRIRTSTSGDSVTAALGAAGLITFTGITVTNTQTFRAIMYKTSPGTTFPTITSAERMTSANYVRGNTATIYLVPTTLGSETDSERWLRVQSIDWSVNMKVNPLKQIAYAASGTPVYARLPVLPFDISVNVSTLEDDWADWARMLTADTNVKNIATPAGNVYKGTYDFSPASLRNSFAVNLKYFDKTKQLLQEIRFTDLRIDSYGNRVNVGGRGEISWKLMGTAMTIIGYNV